MEEKWIDIKGFEGVYAVSNKGRIKSYDRVVPRKNGTSYKIAGRIMKPCIAGKGKKRYYAIDLFERTNRKHIMIHRLVAMTFLHNPNNYPCINHKNEDKFDNRVDNLEWCSYSYNNSYNGVALYRNRNRCIPVSQFTENGTFIRSFQSINEASRVTGIRDRTIRNSCKANLLSFSKRKPTSGFRWKYYETETDWRQTP